MAPSEEDPDKHDSRHQAKFPKRLAFGVWIVQFYNGIQYSEIFTLAVYVVRRFEGPDASESRIGQLAGLLAAASSFAVGTAAWPWGLLSDRIGRKAIILLGNCSTATCIVLFSLSKRYWQALLFRFLAGILDGSLVMTKVMVGETCTPHMQARVMSMLALGDAMGNIVGPSLGGLLAEPCDRFLKDTALCKEGSALAVNPFLLPCAVTACLGALTTFINIFFMEETLARLRGKSRKEYTILEEEEEEQLEEEEGEGQSKTPLSLSRALTSPDSVAMSECAIEGLLDQSEISEEADKTIARRQSRDEMREKISPLPGKVSEVELQSQDKSFDSLQSRASTLSDEDEGLDVRWGDDQRRNSHPERKQLLPSTDASQSKSKPQSRDPESNADQGLDEPWWRNRSLVLTLVVTAWMLSIAKYNDELGPIFVSAPVKQGGLGMPLSAFAAPLTFGGVVLTLFALFAYPPLQRAVGLKMTCSLGLLVGIPGDLLLPTAALVQSKAFLQQAIIYIAIAITKLTTQTAFTSSMVIINSLAPRAQLGSVNGIRMTMAALGRSSGPILGGTIWGLSASLHFPGHHFLGFLVPSLALVGCWLLHHSIPINL